MRHTDPNTGLSKYATITQMRHLHNNDESGTDALPNLPPPRPLILRISGIVKTPRKNRRMEGWREREGDKQALLSLNIIGAHRNCVIYLTPVNKLAMQSAGCIIGRRILIGENRAGSIGRR